MLSNLTAEQKNLLQKILPKLELVADIANAVVTVYVPGEDKKFFYICKQANPLEILGQTRANLTGRRIRVVEEPLVERALQMNVDVRATRKREEGIVNRFAAYPLCDLRGRCFAVLTFDTVTASKIIVDMAKELLLNLPRPVNENLYHRLTPTEGILVVSPQRQVLAANNQARHIFQIMGIDEIVGKSTNHALINWPLVGMVIDTGIGESKEFIHQGLRLSIRVLPTIPKAHSGSALVIIQDVTELRKKDEELLVQSVVIKEIHHRVKNNLQTIASLLRLQERRAVSEEAKFILHDCLGRVNSIAIVHEYLSQQDTGMIDVAKVAKGIYQALLGSMLDPSFQLETSFEADEIELSSEKATSIALILNELLQNAVEHAFVGRQQGRLEVSFKEAGEAYHLTIADDGVGLGQETIGLGKASLGLKIIRTMAEADLGGSFTQVNRATGGTLARVVIPKGGKGC